MERWMEEKGGGNNENIKPFKGNGEISPGAKEGEKDGVVLDFRENFGRFLLIFLINYLAN